MKHISLSVNAFYFNVDFNLMTVCVYILMNVTMHNIKRFKCVYIGNTMVI